MYLLVDIQDSCTYTESTSKSYGGGKMKNLKLIQARDAKKLTQEQLAKKLGYKGKQSVANWENGYALPPLDTAIQLSKVLEKEVTFLFGDHVQDTHTSDENN